MGPLADLFVEDGVWDGRPMIPLADGREEIQRIISEGSRPVRFVMHYVSNANIHIAEDGKNGLWEMACHGPLYRPGWWVKLAVWYL